MTRLHVAMAAAVFTATVLLMPVSAGAEICVLDEAPAATLLLPYFEVDLDDFFGVSTVFSVVNTSADSVYARVVLWTDAAYPTFGYDLYLTGYDVQSFNLRDVFEGRLPLTGPGSSPLGPYSGPDVVSSSCGRAAPEIDYADFLQRAHTGRASSFTEGRCAGFRHRDNVARGYVTIDVTNGCTMLMPSDEGYFGKDGPALDNNVLIGEFLYVEPGADNARGDNLVAIEADPELAGEYTFYGRYFSPPTPTQDHREPLPPVWINRYIQGGGLYIESTQIVWRSTPGAPELFDCSTKPKWYPMESGEVLSFNEYEDAVFWSTDSPYIVFIGPPSPPFPAAVQRVPGQRAWDFGWEIMDLSPSRGERSQAFVMETMSAQGRFSVLRKAVPVGSGCSVEGCPYGDTPIGRVCILRPADGSLDPGDDLAVEVVPKGCFSSSCTLVYRSLCDLRQTDATTFDVDAVFCLRHYGEVCTEDCGGGGSVRCARAGGLGMGDYTLRAGGAEMMFSVPSEIPPGGLCIGDPFN